VAESSTCVFRDVKRGYRRLEGSIPLVSIAGVASFDARSAISRLDASGSLEPTTIGGCENGDVLDFSRDRADEMDCWHVKKLVYRVDRDLRVSVATAATPEVVLLLAISSAIPSRGKSVVAR
jgi:hypothetical protein